MLRWADALRRDTDGIPGTLQFIAVQRMAEAHEGPAEELRYDRRASMAPKPPQVSTGLS